MEKTSQFIEKVYEAGKGKYQPDMLSKFIEYWTEKNTGGKKMLWEKKPVFDIAKRLQTWKRNETTNFGRNIPEKPDSSPTTREGAITKGLEMLCKAYNKPLAEAITKAGVYGDALEKVPTEWLLDVFKAAIKTCRFFPSPKSLLEAWQDVEFKPGERQQEPKQDTWLNNLDTDLIAQVRQHSPGVVDYLMQCGLAETPHLPLNADQMRLFGLAFGRKYGVKL